MARVRVLRPRTVRERMSGASADDKMDGCKAVSRISYPLRDTWMVEMTSSSNVSQIQATDGRRAQPRLSLQMHTTTHHRLFLSARLQCPAMAARRPPQSREAPPAIRPSQITAHRRPANRSVVSYRPTSASRVHLKVTQQFFLCKAKTYESEVVPCNFAAIPSSLLTAEREEAKAVLTLFLKKQGLSNTVAARVINKSECFVDHLILKLHSMHKSRYLVGRELTTLEIRGAFIPFLESLLEEHGDALVDFIENFPDPPGTERAASTSPVNSTSSSSSSSSKKERAIARVSQLSPDGLLPEHVLYLVDLGLKLEQIKDIVRKFPAFAYYNLDRKIKPLVEFLLELGVPRSDIPTILIKRPQLCGISFSENLKPMMAYLENLGVDKSKWAKVIYRFPALLTYSRQKVKATIDYLCELGVSEKNIGKILTRCPHIISYSIEDKLRPTADYFQSIGIDVASLMHKCPQTFGLSIEANLKPVTEFFLERGYSTAEVSTMVHRYGALYTFSLVDNLIPKWNYFLTMDYPKSELVKFPHYFGYSLEERIKPRYSRVRECGVKLVLNQVLSVSNSQFEKILEKKMEKLLDAHFPHGQSK